MTGAGNRMVVGVDHGCEVGEGVTVVPRKEAWHPKPFVGHQRGPAPVTREHVDVASDTNPCDNPAMLSFLLVLRRFATVLRLGWKDEAFRALATMTASWVAVGTLVYSVYEGWDPVESLYFCVMTATTIGYGDYRPTDNWMRLFTVVYSIMGIGMFVGFTARVVELAVRLRRTGSDGTGSRN